MKSFILYLFALSPVFSVVAQDEFEKVEVLDHPKYSLTGRFTLDLDFQYLPLDGYYKPLMAEAAVSFQPLDWFSWEILRGGYSLHNYDAGLASGLLAANPTIEIPPGELKLKDMRYHLGSSGFINLLYSKSNWFNQAVVYHYWQIGSGFSYYDLKNVSQQAMDLTMRVRFFIDNRWIVNIRGGHSIGFNSDAPKNITFLSVGVGFAF